MKLLVGIVLATMAFACPSISAAPVSGAFDQTLELQGIRFRITSANKGSVNVLRVVPSGRLTQRKLIEQEVLGTVTGAEIADLDADGWPEVYVYVTSGGSGSYGTVIGFAVNRGKSITPITLPELMDDPVASKGYQGHDEFSIIEMTLGRRFPVYREGDSNGAPTGGKRQLAYRLKGGEAGWILQLDKAKTRDF
jgi:hypothetical protein